MAPREQAPKRVWIGVDKQLPPKGAHVEITRMPASDMPLETIYWYPNTRGVDLAGLYWRYYKTTHDQDSHH